MIDALSFCQIAIRMKGNWHHLFSIRCIALGANLVCLQNLEYLGTLSLPNSERRFTLLNQPRSKNV